MWINGTVILPHGWQSLTTFFGRIVKVVNFDKQILGLIIGDAMIIFHFAFERLDIFGKFDQDALEFGAVFGFGYGGLLFGRRRVGCCWNGFGPIVRTPVC